MTSVGYGDILPTNIYEISFVTFTMFIACFVFAYTFNLIGILFQDINKNKKEFNNNMKILTRYLEQKNIGHTLQMEVRKSLEYQYYIAESKTTSKEEEHILELMSEDMKNKLKIASNFQYIQKCKALYENFDKSFLEELSLHIESYNIMNQEVIYKNGEISEEQNYIYFIESGEIEVCVPYQNHSYRVIQVLKKNDYFGEYGFFANIPRTTLTRSIGTSYLLKLNQQTFLKVLRKYPVQYEKYIHLKDRVLCNNQPYLLKSRCGACNQEGHTIETCYKLHKILDKEVVILKDRQSIPQERKSYQRQRERQVGYLDILEELEEDAEILLYNLEDWEQQNLNALYPDYEVQEQLLEEAYNKKMKNQNTEVFPTYNIISPPTASVNKIQKKTRSREQSFVSSNESSSSIQENSAIEKTPSNNTFSQQQPRNQNHRKSILGHLGSFQKQNIRRGSIQISFEKEFNNNNSNGSQNKKVNLLTVNNIKTSNNEKQNQRFSRASVSQFQKVPEFYIPIDKIKYQGFVYYFPQYNISEVMNEKANYIKLRRPKEYHMWYREIMVNCIPRLMKNLNLYNNNNEYPMGFQHIRNSMYIKPVRKQNSEQKKLNFVIQ